MSNKIKIMIFSYDFPHQKTQHFLLKLILAGYEIKYVIAAPKKNLGLPSPTVRTSLRRSGFNHPRQLCKFFSIPYYVAPHDSTKCKQIITQQAVPVGVIAGARILPESIIDLFSIGILNLHPGYLPDVRGLDTLKWTIYLDKKLAITAHLISPRIDAGKLVKRIEIPVYEDDTLFDLEARLLDQQAALLIDSLKNLALKKKLKNLNTSAGQYNTVMPHNLEKKVLAIFKSWKKKHLAK